MAISLKHSFTSAVADDGDTSVVRPSNWNAEHDLVIATSRLIGRTTASTGPAEEISVGTGLSLSAGVLDANAPDALSTASGSAPSYSARAWANFNGTASPITIGGSGNVTSITDHGTGDYTVNITTAMPDSNYSFTASSNNVGVVGENSTNVNRTTSALRIRIVGSGGTTNRDCSQVNVAFFD